MRQESDWKVKDAHFECDDPQGLLNATGSKPLVVCKSLTALHERIDHHLGRWKARYFWLESFQSASVFRLVNGDAHSLSDKDAAHRARLTSVVVLASDNWELDLQTYVRTM